MILETIAITVAKSTLSAIVKPVIDKALSGIKTLPAALIDIFTDRFSSYLQYQLERQAYLNTLVFESQKRLEDLYIPLTVIPSLDGMEQREKGIKLDSFKKEFMPSNNRVLITDTAGMGKSTLMKFLFLECIRTGCAVPIFIELRHLSQHKTILDLIEQHLNIGIDKLDNSYFTRQQIERVIKVGELVFFFDGYDEIPFKDREQVTLDLKSFISLFPNNMIAITSRPETGLAAFPSFKQYTIRPLEKDESFNLIRKYDKNGPRSQQLIERLVGREFKSVMEFLKNPLLTTLLYRCYEYKQNLPLKKPTFYRQVFDALFDWHDSSKDGYNTREKKSKLDIDSFHRVLRVMGIISVMKGEVEGDKDTVLDWIRSAKRLCEGITFSESDFLEDIIRAVPIFVKDGAYYRWSHKSLAEYFAAQYVCTDGKQMQEKLFTSMWESGELHRYYNMLDQVYDLDITAFRKYFIIPVAREFSTYWNNSYKGFLGYMSVEDVNLRKTACFGAKYIISEGLSFDRFDRLQKSIQPLLKESSTDASSPEPENVPFAVSIQPLKSRGGKDTPLMVLSVPKRYETILSILESKKDSLIQHKSRLESSAYKVGITKKAIKSIVEVTDNIDSELNNKRNFNAVTKLLYASHFCIAVDTNKMLAFEDSFKDEVNVSDFAQELLSSGKSSDKISKLHKLS